MNGFDPKEIEDPYGFIGDLHDRLVGLEIDLEERFGRYENMEYQSRASLDMIDTIVNWMEAQQKNSKRT